MLKAKFKPDTFQQSPGLLVPLQFGLEGVWGAAAGVSLMSARHGPGHASTVVGVLLGLGVHDLVAVGVVFKSGPDGVLVDNGEHVEGVVVAGVAHLDDTRTHTIQVTL